MSLPATFVSHEYEYDATAESMPRRFRYADFSIGLTRYDMTAPMV